MRLTENRMNFRNLLDDVKLGVNFVKILRSQKRLSHFAFKLLLLFVVTMMVTDFADAAVYYIDKNTGNDSANGSITTPWKTISKANNTLNAGDTVNIRAGIYPETISPKQSGTTENPITYAANESDNVLITGSGSVSPVIIGSDYIFVEGLNIKKDAPPAGSHFADILIRGSHNKIKACKIINNNDRFKERSSGVREIGIVIIGGSYNKIENNVIKYLSFNGIKLKSAIHTTILNNEIVDNYSNSISITTAYNQYSGLLIKNNRLGGSSVSDGIQFNGNFDSSDFSQDQSNQGAIISGNVISNNAENGIDLKGTRFILIENNIICGGIGNNDGSTDNQDDRIGGVGAITTGSNASSSDVIIRGNLMYDNNGAVLVCNGYKVYNNTILGNNRDYTGSNSNFSAKGSPMFAGIFANSSVQNGAIKNNIIAGHNIAELSVKTSSAQLDIDYNLYYNDSQTTLVDFQGKSNWTRNSLDQWKSLLLSRSNISGNDQNSIEGAPRFVSKLSLRPTGNLNMQSIGLNSNSIAIDKGGFLTTTTNSGSGNIVYVKDAGYFCDGYGASVGDLIKVGNNDVVQVMSIDYANNMVVINGKISWNVGDDVTLKYNGSRPDIGAAEYLSAVIPAPSLQIVVAGDK